MTSTNRKYFNYGYTYQTKTRNARNIEAATNTVFDLLMTSKTSKNEDVLTMALCISNETKRNITLIFLSERGSHVRLRHPSSVYISAQCQYTAIDAYTSKITILALHPSSVLVAALGPESVLA